jgi:hypothetical protein
LNVQPPYIREETIRGALRRLRSRQIVESLGKGYWILNDIKKSEAVKLIRSAEKLDVLDGVSSPLTLKELSLIGSDWLDFSRIKFESSEPFSFRIDYNIAQYIRKILAPGKKRDRSHKRSFINDFFSISLTHKGAVCIWVKAINFMPSLIEFLSRANLSEENKKLFFRSMFSGRPKVGNLEYRVKASKSEADLLKSVKVKTFDKGPSELVTEFVSSHDSIELQQHGNIRDLQEFLGLITGVSHSTIYEALQVERLRKIEESLNINNSVFMELIKSNSQAIREIANTLDKFIEKMSSTPKSNDVKPKKDEKIGIS